MKIAPTLMLAASALFFVTIGCRLPTYSNTASGGAGANASSASNSAPNNSAATSSPAKKAYRISGNIDDAHQEGNVCDTSIKFKVPGTLEFEFTPETPTRGKYSYSGPFNATGSGPYEIRDDGTMLVDGTGCIMGKCATYSHKWKAEPIDPAKCK